MCLDVMPLPSACEEGALAIFMVGDVSGCRELQKGRCRRSSIVVVLVTLREAGVRSYHKSSQRVMVTRHKKLW